MAPSSGHKVQTIKQAKKAFKGRGLFHLDDKQRKQLERGAELLERADRIKQAELKKKDWLKKRLREEAEEKKTSELLGSQLRLDKFGHASSQFHLGRFFRTGRGNSVAAKPDSGTDTDEHQTMRPAQDMVGENVLACESENTEAMMNNINNVDIDRKIGGTATSSDAENHATVSIPLAKSGSESSFPSFSSADGFFDDLDAETVLRLDPTSQTVGHVNVTALREAEKSQPLFIHSKMEVDRMSMPPPAPRIRILDQVDPSTKPQDITHSHKDGNDLTLLKLKHCSPTLTKFLVKPTVKPLQSISHKIIPMVKAVSVKSESYEHKRLPKAMSRPSLMSLADSSKANLERFGITNADLEDLVANDVVLSQWHT